MKTFFKILTMAIIVVSIFTACQNDNALVSEPTDNSTSVDSSVGSTKNGSSTVSTSTTTVSSYLTEDPVSPKFGKPNSTLYIFTVDDKTASANLSIKLYNKATGEITYLPMYRIGCFCYFGCNIPQNGWYDYRYVYSLDKRNISNNSYTLCNTDNELTSSGVRSLTWPFGADGSSWTNRSIYSGAHYQKWLGGSEGGNGDGPGQGYHKGYEEAYSDDWNRGNGNDDFGTEIRSPLDGYVEKTGYYISSLGTRSNYVSIIQNGSDGKVYRFYVAHLNTIDISEGRYVSAGITKIGTLGMSGTTSAHAHCNLRNITNGDSKSIEFKFNAK